MGLPLAGIVPVSALRGDNVAQRSPAPWYAGPSLLQLLEALPNAREPRFKTYLSHRVVKGPCGSWCVVATKHVV